ncbi:MAG: 3-dehydroquinate synthase [Gammaproteobacteria bacterium]|nr:3-dehydroquinate synthase [Gammaproteobacteria bacterium]
MNRVDVELGERSYPILIGADLLEHGRILDPFLGASDIMIVTNDVVGPLYLDKLRKILGDRRVHSVVLPDGEASKTIETLQLILDHLVDKRFSRDCVLLTLGGGVVGDIGGFAAATYQRGVAFIQVPTTLLAQVDSAVGGKTGVNHPGGKNLIGAFHQPRCVLIDTSTLTTLPDREFMAGLAEVVKYGLIADADFFGWLERHADDLLNRDTTALDYIIRRSCRIKADIVALDEREKGQRALLNLGHTYGHAIERTLGYGEWLHGEAVAAGICMAAAFAERLGMLSAADRQRIHTLLVRLRLPTSPPQLDAQKFLAAMSLDKKVRAGGIRLVLLRSIGSAEVTADYPEQEMVSLLREQLAH